MRLLFLIATVSILSWGCSSSGGGSGGGSAAGGGTGGTGGGSGHVVNAASACPHVLLNNTLPVTYQGDTSPVPNWVTSTRLEWTDAPDDSLRFVTPSTGNFYFTISSSNSNLGVSIKNSDGSLHAAQGCPAAGATFANDGWYESPAPTDGGVGYPSALDGGTMVLIWISAPYWAAQKTGAYTLEITRQ